jgi:hypothetical protein
MKSDEEYKERYGDDPEEIVAKHITQSSDEEKYLVRTTASEVSAFQKARGESYHKLLISAEFFHGLYNSKFNIEDIDPEDVTITIEIPADKFQRECKAAVENSNGIFVSTDESEVENELIQYVPKVVVVDDTEDEDE